MRQIKTLVAFCLLAAFCLSLLGCGGPTLKEEDILGQWVAVKKTTVGGGHDIGFVIEFFKDKTVSLPIGKGTWAIEADGRLKIAFGDKVTMFGTLAEGQLTINYPKDMGTIIFKRNKAPLKKG